MIIDPTDNTLDMWPEIPTDLRLHYYELHIDPYSRNHVTSH